MNPSDCKRILEKQLQLLSEASERQLDSLALSELTSAMVEIAECLHSFCFDGTEASLPDAISNKNIPGITLDLGATTDDTH